MIERTFTVGELIAELLKFNQTDTVVVDGYEGGYTANIELESLAVEPSNMGSSGFWGEFDYTYDKPGQLVVRIGR